MAKWFQLAAPTASHARARARARARALARALALALALALLPAAAGAAPVVCFTPGEDCTGLIVREIAAARQEIRVQAYSFTSPEIAAALAEAQGRGVAVRAILDKSQRTERYSGADYLAHHGVEVLIDAAHAIAHNKVMVIDGGTVITGSFNFTRAAQERNAENLLVLADPEVAARYLANWEAHARHAEPYAARAGDQPPIRRRGARGSAGAPSTGEVRRFFRALKSML